MLQRQLIPKIRPHYVNQPMLFAGRSVRPATTTTPLPKLSASNTISNILHNNRNFGTSSRSSWQARASPPPPGGNSGRRGGMFSGRTVFGSLAVGVAAYGTYSMVTAQTRALIDEVPLERQPCTNSATDAELLG